MQKIKVSNLSIDVYADAFGDGLPWFINKIEVNQAGRGFYIKASCNLFGYELYSASTLTGLSFFQSYLLDYIRDNYNRDNVIFRWDYKEKNGWFIV